MTRESVRYLPRHIIRVFSFFHHMLHLLNALGTYFLFVNETLEYCKNEGDILSTEQQLKFITLFSVFSVLEFGDDLL
jgi:hypothetical protein